MIRDTARDELPAAIDLDACRSIIALAEAIERGVGTPDEDAKAAVELILCSYQRAQFDDRSTLATTLGFKLTERASGLVAMVADPEHGIAGQERHPPSLAVLMPFLNATSDKVKLASYGAQRALGLRGSPRRIAS